MVLKIGDKGDKVKELQELLGITVDGDFGPKTEKAVKEFQKDNGLIVDGVVGPITWDCLGVVDTDLYESGEIKFVEINKNYLPESEYYSGPVKKDYLFLHHTAGWDNPYQTIDIWGRDTQGRIATEFVVGGQSIKGTRVKYDGDVVQAFPDGGYAWHLGKNGSQYMHKHSVGIEICNFGYLTKGGYFKKKQWVEKDPYKYYAYQGTEADPNQIITLDEEFRGHKHWQRYSELQLNETKQLILYIAERDNIDVRDGLIAEIKKNGVKGFDFNSDAYYGKVKGMWTHTNTRKDKFDLFPQPELIDMLLSI